MSKNHYFVNKTMLYLIQQWILVNNLSHKELLLWTENKLVSLKNYSIKITESWINCNSIDFISGFMLDGYKLFTHNRKLARGGGVIICMQKKIKVWVLNTNTISFTNILIGLIKIKNNVLIWGLYINLSLKAKKKTICSYLILEFGMYVHKN